MPKGQAVLCPNDPPKTGKGLRPLNIPGMNEEKSGWREFEARRCRRSIALRPECSSAKGYSRKIGSAPMGTVEPEIECDPPCRSWYLV